MTNVLIGYDAREPLTYEVCVKSLRNGWRIEDGLLLTEPVIQEEVRQSHLYVRPVDSAASTQFSLTRFLVPWLAHERYAVFCDCDFIFTRPIADMVKETIENDPGRAVWVVQHNVDELWENNRRNCEIGSTHRLTKMTGAIQELYPRKWWSALMLWDCYHPAVRDSAYSLNAVNHSTPAELHRFNWLPDKYLGRIDPDWHWLDGYSLDPPEGHTPAGIHLTRGTPEHGPPWDKTRYAPLWQEILAQSKLPTKN